MAQAQVAVDVNIGPAPVCPYGYFDYAPYDCAPYGYYGPDWFAGGVFIGAGPKFHGPRGFYGQVDSRFDPHHGYNGPLPERGAQRFNHFQETRRGMGEATLAPLPTKGGLSTRSPDIGVVAMPVDTAAGTTRAQSGLRDPVKGSKRETR